jgi:excisionase family DNA binding protein
MTRRADSTHDSTNLKQPEIGVRLLRAEEVADFLQVSLSFVYALIERGELPSVRLGRAVRVQPEDLIRFTDANRRNGHPVAGGAQCYSGKTGRANP